MQTPCSFDEYMLHGSNVSLTDFAEALSNPIAYQSQLEKHAQQLAVLEEDFEVEVFFFYQLH